MKLCEIVVHDYGLKSERVLRVDGIAKGKEDIYIYIYE